MAQRSSPRGGRASALRGLPVLVVAGVIMVALAAPAVHGATDKGCRIRNTDSGRLDQGLRTAVSAAAPGDRLVVKGTCGGGVVIRKHLVIVGLETRRTGKPTISGGDVRRVLAVARGAKVKLRDLRVVRGRARTGAGIFNRGHLVLTDVRIGRNTTTDFGSGGGIFNRGLARVNGASRISHNFGDAGAGGVWNEGRFVLSGSSLVARNGGVYGNGVDNLGTFVMNGSSAVNANWSSDEVGGVSNGGTFTMNDRSTIANNDGGTAWGGPGGVDNHGRFVMNDRSTIRDNEGGVEGGPGGVDNRGRFVMNDRSAIHGNVAYCTAGGVWAGRGTFRMTRDSSIHGNRALAEAAYECDGRGGGVFRAGGTLVGVTCGADARVHGNEPDDCAGK